jgi:hypothetical protein
MSNLRVHGKQHLSNGIKILRRMSVDTLHIRRNSAQGHALNIEQSADGLQASSHRNGGVIVLSGLLAL